jgi:hypothetical protein
MPKSVRHTNTPNLVRIMQAGRAEEFNRTVGEDYENTLDPKGEHVVSFAMVHEHKGGQSVDPHMRVALLTKMEGTEEPSEVLMDMSMADYDSFTVSELTVTKDGD